MQCSVRRISVENYGTGCSLTILLEVRLSEVWLTGSGADQFVSQVKHCIYSQFHKTLPKLGLHMHWTSGWFYEMGVIYRPFPGRASKRVQIS